MGIDLAVEGQKFRLLSGDIHFLFLEPVLVNGLYQVVDTAGHQVVAFHQDSDFILSPHRGQGFQFIDAAFFKSGATLHEP